MGENLSIFSHEWRGLGNFNHGRSGYAGALLGWVDVLGGHARECEIKLFSPNEQ